MNGTKKRGLRVFAAALAVAAILVLALTGCDLFSKKTGGISGGGTYTVNLVLDGGTGVLPADFLSGSTLVEPAVTPTKTGYVFDGWYSDKEHTTKIKFGVKLKENDAIYIYAAWKLRPYIGTFVFGGKEPSVSQEASGGKFSPVVPEEKKGYEFLGWYDDVALKNSVEDWEATADRTFYAKWQIKEYTIQYDCDGLGVVSSLAQTVYTVEDTVDFKAPRDIEAGYTFLGWFDQEDNKVEMIREGTTENFVLKAKYVSRNKKMLGKNGVSVNESAKTASIGIKYSAGETKVVFDDVIEVSPRATYTVHKGWDEETAEASCAETEVLAEGVKQYYTVKVYPESGEPQSYKLTVEMFGDQQVQVIFSYPSGSDSNEWIQKGERVTRPKAEDINDIEGYTFDDWYADSEYKTKYDFSAVVTDFMTVYAKYVANRYTITYNTGIWEEGEDFVKEYTVNDAVTFLSPVGKNGLTERYEFVGWYNSLGAKVTGIEVGTLGNMVLTAKYSLKEGEKAAEFGNSFTLNEEIYAEDFKNYLAWGVWNRITDIEVTMLVSNDIPDGGSYISNQISSFFAENESANALADFDRFSYTSSPAALTAGSKVYDRYVFTVKVAYVDPSKEAADEDKYSQLEYPMHNATSTRGNGYDGFPINSITDTVAVTDSDQLLYAVSHGYRPLPTAGSAAETIYNAAKAALRTIIDDGNTDDEKVHAIYDWLVKNVAYDYDLLEIAGSSSELSTAQAKEFKTYNGFSLEGVFVDGRAVCDGISKAFVLMCGIEGIESVRVVGNKTGGEGHAWNKVKLRGKWYNVDATAGGLLLSVKREDEKISSEGLTHRFFMLTDEQMVLSNIPDNNVHGQADKVADTEYNFYATQKFVYSGTEYDYVISTSKEWDLVAQYAKQFGADKIYDFKVGYLSDESTLRTTIGKAFNDALLLPVVVYYDEDSRTVIIWVLSDQA